MIFLFAGPAVMEYMFRVSLDELRIAGGLILVVMGIKNLLFPGAVKDFSHYQDMSDWTDPMPFIKGTFRNISKVLAHNEKSKIERQD